MNNKITAIKLIAKLAETLKQELCEKYVVPELISIANNPREMIRKFFIEGLIEVCKVVSYEFFIDKLLPIYRSLAKDKNWSVREAAVKVIPSIARILDKDRRETLLVKIYKGFCEDESQFVRRAARLQLGHLIFSLQDSKIDAFIIQLYISLNPKLTKDKELIYHCAYSFPAVLLILGKDNWVMVQTIYKYLVSYDTNNIPIMKTLASSVHEVAKIIGSETAFKDLDPIVKKYLENVNTIQSCFNHFHEYLEVLTEEMRFTHIDTILQIIDNSKLNWRLRETFALHGKYYAQLFDIHIIYNKFIPITFKMLEDTVITIRTLTCSSIYYFIRRLEVRQDYFMNTVTRVKLLSYSESFRDRQCFIRISANFMQDEHLFKKHFLTSFLLLQKDVVPNIRIALAQVIRENIKLIKDFYILRTIEILKNDSAREVRELMSQSRIEEKVVKNIEVIKSEKEREGSEKSLENEMNDEEEIKVTNQKDVIQFVKKKFIIDEIEVKDEVKNKDEFNKEYVKEEVSDTEGIEPFNTTLEYLNTNPTQLINDSNLSNEISTLTLFEPQDNTKGMKESFNN